MTAIAIDFGTSNTVVCMADPQTQKPQTLSFDRLSRRFQMPQGIVSVVPSLAFVQSPEHLMVGEQVRSQRLGFAQPDRYFQAFKRDLAADFQSPPRSIDGQRYSAERIAEQFLHAIWQAIPPTVQPDRVIFTAPVGAFERYLDWFRSLGDRLGVPVVQIVDESTAAALGYAVQRPGAIVLVIDFGGGTLDLSLVRTAATVGDRSALRAEVLAKSDAYVGGVDIDSWIVEHYLQQAGLSRPNIGEIGWQSLLELAERLKIQLSTAVEATESWFDDEQFMAHELRLTREDFADILEARQLLEQMRQAIDDVLAIALQKGIRKTDIERVLLVGGSCQIPAVQQLILSYFGKQRVRMHKPFEAVAHGALALSQVAEVEDYLHHSYAIRLWEPYAKTYSYYTLFERGVQYPCQRRDPLTLQVAIEGQREIRLDIGEMANVTQAEVTFDAQGRMTSTTLQRHDAYRSLETQHDQVCIAQLDPPGQVGIDRILVQFEVTADRILIATVRDLLTEKILMNRAAIAKL